MFPRFSDFKSLAASRIHQTWRAVFLLALGVLLSFGPLSACAFGGRKAELQSRKNTVIDEVRDLVPAVLAAKQKARGVLAKRRLADTAMSLRGGIVDGARYSWSSTHAGIAIRGTVQAAVTGQTSAPATIEVTKSGSKKAGSKR